MYTVCKHIKASSDFPKDFYFEFRVWIFIMDILNNIIYLVNIYESISYVCIYSPYIWIPFIFITLSVIRPYNDVVWMTFPLWIMWIVPWVLRYTSLCTCLKVAHWLRANKRYVYSFSKGRFASYIYVDFQILMPCFAMKYFCDMFILCCIFI